VRWLKNYLNWRRRETERRDPQIVLGSDGFSLIGPVSGDLFGSVLWRDVQEVRAFKMDLLTTDCVVLVLDLLGGKPPVQVSEEWPGFAEFRAELLSRLPAIPAEWYSDVVQPPFERNFRVLYTRPPDAVV
jgi:hypothetical protein